MTTTVNEPAERMRAAIDELAKAFPVDEISDAPWVVERGSIAWMVREGEQGPQVGNFLLEADARWVAATRNALAAERAIGAEALDVEAVASVLCSMRHGGSTDLATCLRAATDRADASMFVNRYARLTRERNGQ